MGAWDLDLTTGLLRGTVQFFRIMGLEPTTEPVPIETTRRLRHPDDGERVLKGFNDSLARGADYIEAEYRIIRPDGELRWIFGRGHVIRDATGMPLRHCGIDIDITGRKQAEAALRDSEERFRRVFEQSPLGKAMAGLDFRFRAVNPALCKMLDYTADELIGRSFLDVVHPDDREKCAALGQTLIDGSAPQIQIEERFVRRSGESLLGERQCRADPRCGRPYPLHTRRHREHRRTQADSPRPSWTARQGCGYSMRDWSIRRRNAPRSLRRAGRNCRRSSSTRRTG